jgi:thiamine kinase-like enzyme
MASLQYLNNPKMVCEHTVTVENREESVLEAIRLIVPAWKKSKLDDVNVLQLSGGITNTMYLITWNKEKIICRLFGDGSEKLINRETENILFASLSKLNMGCPVFYGLFSNGRIEGYLPARSITAEEMQDPFIYLRLGAAAGRFHTRGSTLNSNEVSHENRMHGENGQFDQYIELVKQIKFPDGSKEAALMPGLEIEYMINEVDWLNNWLQEQAAISRSVPLDLPAVDTDKKRVFIPASMLGDHANHRNIARYLAFQNVLCHYDMLSGNILVDLELADKWKNGEDIDSSNSSGVTLIDYEYSSFTYRAFDLGNFFCEFAGFDKSIEEAYPESNIRRAVIATYLDSCSIEYNGDDVEGRIWRYWQSIRQDDSVQAAKAVDCIIKEFEIVANQLTLCAHTLWYLWGIVQADVSTVDFDYMDYSKVRLEGYRYHKEIFHNGNR